MDIEKAKNIIKDTICTALKENINIADDAQLIGSSSLLDSMKLVEICLALEDIADDYNFEFDWTSDATMSKSRSIFRTISSLAEEFVNQSSKDAA